MVYESQYKATLTDSYGAVEQIGSNTAAAIGRAVCQPPALMQALASRAEAANVDNVKVYYMHAEENMKRDPAVVAQNDNVVSVNSTIEMDLTGACNSEYVNGHQFASTGGHLEFVRGAYASKGGMSFIAFQSAIKDG